MGLVDIDGVQSVRSIDVVTTPGLSIEEAAFAAKQFGLALQRQLGRADRLEVLFRYHGRTHNADDIDTSSLEA